MTELSLTQMRTMLADVETVTIGYHNQEENWMQIWFNKGEIITVERNGKRIPNEYVCLDKVLKQVVDSQTPT